MGNHPDLIRMLVRIGTELVKRNIIATGLSPHERMLRTLYPTMYKTRK